MKSELLSTIIIFLIISTTTFGTVLYVPQNYPTTQLAVNAAQSGDTVQVAPGDYGPVFADDKDNISLFGSGMFPPDNSYIHNLTTHGIHIDNSSGLKIRGFEIYNVDHAVIIENCIDMEISEIYAHNSSMGYSVAISIYMCNNTYYHNNIGSYHNYGGIWVSGSSHTRLINNTITNNNENGILILTLDPNLEIINNIVAFNSDNGIESVPIQSGVITTYNDVYGNGGPAWYHITPGVGNIEANPLYSGTPYMYSLSPNSPCIDAGDPEMLDPDGSRSDIGALYFCQGPNVSVSTNSLFFPYTTIGDTSELPLTIYNTGVADLIISEISTSLPEIFNTNWNEIDTVISPNDSLEILVYFSPQQLLYYTDVLTIENNDEDISVYLEGPQPIIEVSNDSLNFPTTTIGDTSQLPLTLYNSGEMELVLYDMSFSLPAIFSVNWNPEDSLLAIGDSLELLVSFSPLSSTMYTDFLTIESNAGTTEIYLNGAESSATVTVDLIPQVLNIQIPPGGGSFNYDIQLINSGPATVVDLWIAVTMPNGYEFPVMMRNNINIAAGATIQRNNLTQFVPGSVPAGVYIYRAYVKNPITWEIISQDSIIFEKMAGEGLLAHNLGWALYGWDNNSPVTELMPSKFSVSASPNPFNPETNISFTLPQPGLVTVKVYDILGREVALIYSGYSQSGLNQVTWNASDFASGIYLVQISYDHQRICQKVLLDK